ncbi:MAG TPA: PP2C family protein-serine/threonine phosphatase [Thermoanaerobaculia bacterium]|jgi:serine phosphatase RsbU (regulator of sigma subunit)|nr:PP2C family protein-serine/threonine phosphatase [Thermoanaerobaculia bacterium]
MPSGHDWGDLLRATFHSVGREDIAGLYSREWRRAKEKLTAEDAESIAGERRRFRRFVKTFNSVLFGLSKRLAPARRVLFLVVLVLFLLSLGGSHFESTTEKEEHGVKKTTHYTLDLDSTFLAIASTLLVFLVAMELVDKINYRDELELARDLQASLIPKTLPTVPGLDIGAYNRIANTVGGDVYDFVPLSDGGLAVLFGDASGHGMAAGLVMAVAHAAFRTQLDVDAAPAAMFSTLNRILCRTGTSRAFFGCVYLRIAADGTFVGSVGGHPLPLLVGREGAIKRRIGSGAYPLGIKMDLAWPVESGALETGDLLLLHSDGLDEARNERGEEFGETRVDAAATRAGNATATEIVSRLAGQLDAFCGREVPDDDVSIAVIRRT